VQHPQIENFFQGREGDQYTPKPRATH